MNFNQIIIKLVSMLVKNNEETNRFLSLDNKSVVVQINNDPLVEINKESILLLGKDDVSQKIFLGSEEKISSHVDFEQFEKFCSDMDILKLNHLGINYSCTDIKKELEHFKKLLTGTNFKLYEEDSGDPKQRWFFVGNLEDWRYPLFELVITESEEFLINEWTPHFQIDIDTNQDISELKELTSKYLKSNFFGWELDVPNHGVVLAMGELGNINGTKICLGIGTNKRDIKNYRKEIFTEVQ